MTDQIENLLSVTYATAPEMTHYLCEFGNGDMGTGIRNLLLCGGGIGSVTTAVIIGGGYWVYHIATKKQRKLREIETIGTSFNAGFEVGKRQERDLQRFIRTVEHDKEDGVFDSDDIVGGL